MIIGRRGPVTRPYLLHRRVPYPDPGQIFALERRLYDPRAALGLGGLDGHRKAERLGGGGGCHR